MIDAWDTKAKKKKKKIPVLGILYSLKEVGWGGEANGRGE